MAINYKAKLAKMFCRVVKSFSKHFEYTVFGFLDENKLSDHFCPEGIMSYSSEKLATKCLGAELRY